MSEGMQVTKGVSLLKPLSAGGMGEVWLADHQGLKTRVVVKFMLGGLDSSDSARTRFSREAAAAAQVKSPHVVQMLDHGVTDAGVPFIVMEHLEGHDLGDEIEKHGAIDPAKVVVVVSQVAKALAKVHAAGLLHRDIKPDNIFLCDGEEDVFAKLLDFGIAKSSAVDQGDGSLDGETKTGQIVGTPYYMSPEQVTAQKALDHRSDLWALGVVAYEALTGKKPYDGPSFGALAVRIATGGPPKLSDVNPALPPSADLWFAKACARDPKERFSSAKEMADAFRAAFEGVVSLPAGAISGNDSGSRGGLASAGRAPSTPDAQVNTGPRASSGSGGEGAFGLAATALDDSDALREQRALGRSEAGMSLVDGGRSTGRTSPLLKIAVPVLAIAAAGVLFLSWSARTPPGASVRAGATSSLPVATSVAPPPVESVVSAPPAVSTPLANAVADAGAAPAVASTTRAPAAARPNVHAKAPIVAPAKPPPEPVVKPTPKPAADPDPLY